MAGPLVPLGRHDFDACHGDLKGEHLLVDLPAATVVGILDSTSTASCYLLARPRLL